MKVIAENLTVARGERHIVEKVSFSLDSGEGLIVTGENGAGKSTLLRAFCGLLPMVAGEVTVENGPPEARLAELIHFLSAKNAMKDSLTVAENLSFWKEFCRSGYAEPGLDPEQALDTLELAHCLDLPFGYLSTGMKRRAALARLLVVRKPVWVLDEPTSGLDARSVDLFSRMLQTFCEAGGILIAATHLPLGLPGAKSLEMKALTATRADDQMAFE